MMLFNSFKNSDISLFLFAFCITSFPAVASISLILFVLGGVKIYNKNRPKLLPKLLVPFILLYLIYLVGLIYSNNIEYGLKIILKISALLIIPITFLLRGSVSIKEVELTKKYFVLGTFSWCGLALIISIASYFINGKLDLFTYYGLAEVLHLHPTYQSFYILASLFFLPMLPSIKKNYKIIIYLFLLIFLFLLQSRIAYLSLIILSFHQIFLYTKKKSMALLLILVPLLIGLFIYLNPLTQRLSELKNIKYSIDEVGTIQENGINQRLWLWQNAVAQIRNSPYVGFGLGSQKSHFRWVIEKDLLFNSYNNQYTQSAKNLSKINLHNQYLQYLYEFGTFGLAVFLIVLIIIGKLLYNKRLFGEILIFSIFSIFMLTENMLDRQMGIYVFTFLISLFIFSNSANTDRICFG
jgi:O-antigen ligase